MLFAPFKEYLWKELNFVPLEVKGLFVWFFFSTAQPEFADV